MILFILYFAYGCLLFFWQEKIIFYPVEYNFKEIQTIQELKTFKYMSFSKNSKIQITYWENYLKKPHFKIIFYFGGNAENTNYTALEISKHPEALKHKWILVNYPGYNGSSGNPGEKNFYTYSIEIYDYITQTYEGQIEEIIFMGRSIGSGVASFLQTKRKCNKLILVTPFDSLETIAKSHFPLYPTKLLLLHKFPVIEHLKNSNTSVFVLIAENDEIIPQQSTKNLLKHLDILKNKEIYIIPYTTHNTISDSPLYWKYLIQSL